MMFRFHICYITQLLFNFFDLQVTLSLSMIPGVLRLKNCREYSVSVYPDGFPALKEDPKGVWDNGFTQSFAYETSAGDVPNMMDSSAHVVLVSQDVEGTVTLDMQKVSEFFTCSPVQVWLETQRSILDDDGKSYEVSLDKGTHNPTGNITGCIFVHNIFFPKKEMFTFS